jgi:hypothetical protein
MLIVGIHMDVWDFLHGAAEDRAGRGAHPLGCDGIGVSYGLGDIVRLSMRGGKMNELPVEPEYMAELSLAQSRRALRDHVKHGLGVGRRSAYGAEHFAGCRLIFERLSQLARPRL